MNLRIEGTPLDELYAKAREFNLAVSLNAEDVNAIVNRQALLHHQWMQHPMTKVLLLALQIQAAESQRVCMNNALSQMSELELRARLNAVNQTNKIETYATTQLANKCIIES